MKPLYEVRPITDLRDMIRQSIARRGDNTAFLVKVKGNDDYVPVSYQKLGEDMDGFGTQLLRMGLGGKRIAVIGENRYEWAVTYLSVVNGVGVIVPIDRELPATEVEELLRQANAEAVVFSKKYSDSISEMSSRLPKLQTLICMDDESEDGFWPLVDEGRRAVQAGDHSYQEASIDPECMSILLFTSGTMSVAKGVMLSHKNIVTNLMNMCKQIDITIDDVFLSVLPLHHTYECTCGFLCPLYRGAAIAYCEGLRYVQKNMVQAKASVILGVPLLFENMYKRVMAQARKAGLVRKMQFAIRINSFTKRVRLDLSKKLFRAVHDSFGGRMRLMISGAAAIDPEVAKGFRDLGILFLQGYGLTECAPIVGVNRDCNFRDDSAGMLLANMEIRIDSPNADGVGEIVVRGDNVMLGYYQNPEATAAVLEDGWFRTGDLGYYDDQKFIFITGRKKSMILTNNGKNVYPEEIEGYLNKYDQVLESFVYGRENEKSGETEICAEIVPDFEYFGGANDDAILKEIESVVREVNGFVPIFKKIHKVHIRKEEFEKTTTKKIKRYKVDTK